MKVINIIFLVGSLCVSSVAFSDPDAEKEAEKLLDTMGMQTAMEQSMSQMFDIQVQQNPALAPYRAVMMEFFKKHMSYESLKPDMLRIYSDAFTASELQEINAFYATNTGKKTIEKMPMLMAQGAQIGAERIQANIGDLQSMIKAEADRIQEAQQK